MRGYKTARKRAPREAQPEPSRTPPTSSPPPKPPPVQPASSNAQGVPGATGPIGSLKFLHVSDLHIQGNTQTAGSGVEKPGGIELSGNGTLSSDSDLSGSILVDAPELAGTMDADKVPSKTGLADQGVTHVERIAIADKLGRDHITRALCKLISQRADTQPLAIGLFGHWGSGKSSQVAFLESALADLITPSIRIAKFNAWHHEKCDNIGAALAQCVVETLTKDMTWLQQTIASVRMAMRREQRTIDAVKRDVHWLKATWIQAFSFIVPFLFLAFPLVYLSFVLLEKVGQTFWTTVATVIGGVGVGALVVKKFVADNLKNWFKALNGPAVAGVFSIPNFSSKLGTFHEIQVTLRILCDFVLNKEEVDRDRSFLLVVIDDLDRCSPSTVKDVFDAVRLVASIDRLVTLVAIDERIAYAAVEKHFKEFGSGARETGQVSRDYLSKIFQVCVNLPPISNQNAEEYIRHIFSGGQSNQSLQESTPERNTQSAVIVTASPTQTAILEAEVEVFVSLSKMSGLENPREIWRMKQAWSLLKGMALPDDFDRKQFEPLMTTLFVSEWLLRMPMKSRMQSEAFRKNQVFSMNILVPPAFQELYKLEGAETNERQQLVNAVLLPAAPNPGSSSNA